MEKELWSMVLCNAYQKELFTTNNSYKSMQKKKPRECTATEFEVLKKYPDSSDDILVMLRGRGESRFDTNINFLLEEYGIVVNNDAVVRNVLCLKTKQNKTKQPNGVLNREIKNSGNNAQALTFVYHFVAVLSTGSVYFQLNRSILAFYYSKSQGEKLAVLGSCHMFTDQYLDKEENSKIMDVVFQWFMTEDIQLNQIDADDPEMSDYMMLPDTATLSEQLRVCLQEGKGNPWDFTTLFDLSIYQRDTTSSCKVIKAHEQLNLKHEPLQLIQPAVFPPSFRELPLPPLELFEDLEFYVRKCGDILGVTSKLPKDQQGAKANLEHIFFQVVEFKKLNQEHDIDRSKTAFQNNV
uniref:Uncharacterized protein n=1 Tax=Microcebus murinus TaxID=30608 RepID=A0A8C5XX46_MICMU